MQNEIQRIEMINNEQQESVSQALGYMTEFLNIQNCIDIKLASAAPKFSSEAFIKDIEVFSSPPRNRARHPNEDIELNIE